MPVFEGIKYGVFLVIMIGPSFFYLIRVSLMKGFTRGAAFAFGILLTDVMFVFSIFFGLAKLFKNIDFQVYASLVGGIVLLVSGIQYLKPSKKHTPHLNKTPKTKFRLGLLGYTMQGIVINGLNPFTIMLWVGILASVMAKHHYNTNDFLLFATGLLGIIIIADVMKAFLANRIAKILTEKVLQLADSVLGILFIVLSIRFFYFFVEHYEEASFQLGVLLD